MLDIGGAKPRALLAVLLLRANEVVSTDRLLDALWEDWPPERAHKALQVYVSQLRKTLGREQIETREPGYMLGVGRRRLDLQHFQRLAGEGRLEDALALWRGEPLAEFASPAIRPGGDRWARRAEARLPRATRRPRSRPWEARGRRRRARRQVVTAPLTRAAARPAHARALPVRGQAEALSTYQDCRLLLDQELGLEPSDQLKQLEKAVYSTTVTGRLHYTQPLGDRVVAGASILVAARLLAISRRCWLSQSRSPPPSLAGSSS